MRRARLALSQFDLECETSDRYATFRGIANCQTKMILGYACGDANVKLTTDDLAEAIRRLRYDFAFVGIQDYFGASVSLAHEMLSPQLEVSTEAQVETKAASHGYTHSEQDLALHNLTTSGYRDMDYDLYDAALQLFKERLDEYDLPLQENTYQQWRKEGTRQGRPRGFRGSSTRVFGDQMSQRKHPSLETATRDEN